MANPPKKSVGPFVLWDELLRDDPYQLRRAFSPSQAEYVAQVKDELDLEAVSQPATELPDVAAVSAPPSNHSRRGLYIGLGVMLVVVGIGASLMVIEHRPKHVPPESEQPVVTDSEQTEPESSKPQTETAVSEPAARSISHPAEASDATVAAPPPVTEP